LVREGGRGGRRAGSTCAVLALGRGGEGGGEVVAGPLVHAAARRKEGSFSGGSNWVWISIRSDSVCGGGVC
jgi:hypothetical protein